MTLNGVMAVILRVRCCRKTTIRPTSVSESTFNTL